MKKLLKTILMIMLMSSLILTFTSCGKDGDKISSSQSDEGASKEDKKNSKEKAEETVDGFMQALCKFDIEKMSKYTLDPDSVKDAIGFDDLKTYVTEEIYSGSTDEEIQMMSTLLEPVIDSYLEAVYDTMSYEITSSKKEGKDYVITTDFTYLDFESAEEKLEGTMNEDMGTAGQEVLTKLMEEGKITEDTTQEEMAKLLFEGVAEKLVPIIEKSIIEAPRATEEFIFFVTQKGENWYIDFDKSETQGAFKFKKEDE